MATITAEKTSPHGQTFAELTALNPDDAIVSAIRSLPTADLRKILRGEVDIFEIASATFADRGMDAHGFWVGFPNAQQHHEMRVEMRNKKAEKMQK